MEPSQKRDNFPLPIDLWKSGKKGVTEEKIWDDANDTKLKGLVKDLKSLYCRLIICTKNAVS